MLDLYKQLIANQYEATFCMLNRCIERCPQASWDAPVVELKFCQVAFHTLFFADLYLGPDITSLRGQPLHLEHAAEFRDYEELEPRRQVHLYTRAFIDRYMAHCRQKAAAVMSAETAESLERKVEFDWLKVGRAELHLYNIRHIQHHAAQLSLRLRIDHDESIPWVQSGWRK